MTWGDAIGGPTRDGGFFGPLRREALVEVMDLGRGVGWGAERIGEIEQFSRIYLSTMLGMCIYDFAAQAWRTSGTT
jgi:hypothetical protein